MRKRVFGRKLKRDKNQRRGLFRSLMISLILNGRIKTTEAKAKSIKGEVEKLVTRGKNKGEEAKKILLARLANEAAADKIIAEIAPKFATRNGGYTRILKIGARLKDSANMVELSWVEEVSKTITDIPKRKTLKKVTKAPAKKVKIGSKEKPTKAKK